MPDSQKFAVLHRARRVWAISGIHGEAARLERLHQALWSRLEPGDRIVYLGNILGRGPDVAGTVDILLRFRAEALARPRSFADDFAFLRGSQEEMWQKLLQLQFATDPRGVLGWMIDQGLGPTLEAYGGSVVEAQREAAAGTLALTRWTGRLREQIQRHPGHYTFLSALRRAAFTDDHTLLFVNTGLDPSRPLETQNDSFWWNSTSFDRITDPYGGFRRVVRGFDPRHPGLEQRDYTLTVDAGCGFGGALLAACLAPDGTLVDQLEA